VIQGQLDVPLDGVGRAQAAAAAAALSAAGPAVVVSSDLSRARETAEELVDLCDVPLRLDARLRELDLGLWQGLTAEQACERFPDEHAAWRAGRDVPRGGGETYRQAGERAAQCVRDSLPDVPDGGTLVAVTHGGTARGATGVLLELDPDSWWRLAPLGNTCWTVLLEGDRGWRLERHGAGLGPPTGPSTGGHDLGDPARKGASATPDVEPVR
jgi:broad specificity phosphatase PhoE